MRIFDRLSLRRDLNVQLLAVYLLFVGPVIGAALIFGRVTGARLEQDIKAADLALARSIALETTITFQNTEQTVDKVAQAVGSLQRPPSELAPLFAAALAARREIDLIYILDQQGIVRYHYPEGPVVVTGVDFSFRPYFAAARQAEQPLISAQRIALSPATGRAVVTAVAPLRDQAGRRLGLIAADLDLRHLSATLSRIFVDHTSGLRVSTVDSNGQIIADSDSGRLFSDARAEFPDLLSAAQGGMPGNQIGRDSTGREWLRSYTPIPMTDWLVVVQRPTDLAFASPRAFQTGLLIAIAIFMGGGLLFWRVLAQRVIAPLQQLADFSSAIAQRTVAPAARTHLARLADRPDQMGDLVRALTQMEQAIERRLTELATLHETSGAVVATLELSAVLDTILEQVQRLLGVERCAIIGLDEARGELRLQAARGLVAAHVTRIHCRPLAEVTDSFSLETIRSRQPVIVENLAEQPRVQGRAQAEGYQALMAVPLLTRHALPSALIVYWQAAHTPPPEEIDLLVHFANHATMALENAALFAQIDEKLREQTHRLTALVQSLHDGLVLEDAAGRILYCNRRICELAQMSAPDIIQQPAAHLRARLFANAQGPSKSARPAPPVVAGGGEPVADEVTIQYHGRLLDLRLHTFDVQGDDGQWLGRGQLWLDVTGDKELDRMKSTLIGTASHELRTPLAIIKGSLSSLLANDVTWDVATQQEFLRVAQNEVDHLTALVTDLLDLSRIEAGTFTVDREQCSLAALVARASEHTTNQGRLQVELPPTLPLLMADPLRITVVLRNLIENGCKYSPAATPVRVSAATTPDALVVAVTNQGPPIPLDQQSKVFERFHRLDSGLARQTNGAGLGLAICKGFVEAHGGKIWVESAATETTFRFMLPLTSNS